MRKPRVPKVAKTHKDARVVKQEFVLENGIRVHIELRSHGLGVSLASSCIFPFPWKKHTPTTVTCTCGGQSGFAEQDPPVTVTKECPTAKFICDCTGSSPKITCLD
jgi:hypothetical protein